MTRSLDFHWYYTNRYIAVVCGWNFQVVSSTIQSALHIKCVRPPRRPRKASSTPVCAYVKPKKAQLQEGVKEDSEDPASLPLCRASHCLVSVRDTIFRPVALLGNEFLSFSSSLLAILLQHL